MREKITPQNIDAEQSSLGAILINRDAASRAGEILRPTDFYLEAHQEIFRAVTRLFDRGQPVDLVTASEELAKEGRLEFVGGAAYLSSLMDVVPSATNIEQYASIVQEKAILRGLINASDRIAGWAYDAEEPVELLVDRAEKTLLEVGQRRIGQYFHHINPLLQEAFDQLDKKGGNLPGVATGFQDLDQLTSGLQKSDFIIIAARPSMGKTALCLNVAEHIAIHAHMPVGIFSLEMSKEQLVHRLISSHARVNGHHIRTGRLAEEEIHRISVAVSDLYNAPIYIDDTPGISTFEIRAKARRLKSEVKHLGLVVVDYLQLVRGPRTENRVQEISEIARSLKTLARELEVPVIAMSQLSRAVEQRDNKRPMLSDLRESGSIEAEADLVMFIYRASYYKQRKDDEEEQEPEAAHGADEAEIIIGKHRNGPTGTIRLTFLKHWARFEDHTELSG
ncbi:MAG: replicative DNA helicase [Armatimonadetes bacterium]|nr:replicative DNA helicase [Armatimonadota bacterium]